MKPIDKLNKKELISIMMELCAKYTIRLHDNQKSANDAWEMIEFVAEDIIRRKNIKKQP